MPSSAVDHLGAGTAAASGSQALLARPVGPHRPSPSPRHAANRTLVVSHSQRLHHSYTPHESGIGSWWSPWGPTAAAAPPAGIAAAAQQLQSSRTVQDATPSSPGTPNPSVSELLRLYEQAQPVEPWQRNLPSVTVRFVVPEFVSEPGQQLIVVGSVAALGTWDLAHGVPMLWQEGHRWTAEVQLDPGWHGALEFKVVLKDRKAYTWEPGGNRLLVVERPKLGKGNSAGNTLQHEQLSPSRNIGVAADQEEQAESDTGPVLCVDCEWGKAEPPSPQLPPSLLCAASTPGILANGMPLQSEPQDALGETPVVMANCQVVIPTLDHIGLGSAPAVCAGALAQEPGVRVVLVGSVPALGCWDPAQGLQLARDESGMWRARLELPMGYSVHAKLVLWDTAQNKVRLWEQGNNRSIRLPEPPASLLQPRSPALSRAGSSSSNSSSSSPGAARAAETSSGGGAAAGAQSAASSASMSAYPVMPGGSFMWLLHWSLPAFPHLLFLPALEDDSSPGRSSTTSDTTPGTDTASDKASSSAVKASRPAQSSVHCKFTMPHFPTQPNQHLLLVGSTEQLGDWDPTRGLRLQWGPGHSWKATTQLPADKEIQAKIVLWDGSAYRWEGGPNRKLHPGRLVRQATNSGMGEVLHILYWANKSHDGTTPAVVIPHDEMLASSTSLAPQRRGVSERPGEGGLVRAGSSATGSGVTSGGGSAGTPGGASWKTGGGNAHVEPSLAVIQLMSFISGLALQHGVQSGSASGIDLEALAGEPGAAKPSLPAFNRLTAASSAQLANLESTLEALRQQLAEATAARQRESDALRQQLAESSKALAAEEDQVESLHAALAGRAADIRNLQQQLACAEATAAAAIAAATTALSSASLMSAGAGMAHDNGSNGNGTDAAAGHNGSQVANGGMNRVAVATFQKLTEQLAVLQLEVDQARQALTEATAAKNAEVAHLRAELSEAVAFRHRDVEAARVAAAAAALTHQQEVSALQNMLADMQSAKERESAALQARMEAVAAASAAETARLARQLAQACAAAEALERQLIQQCSNTAALSASGGAEVRRLKGLLNNQASELEALRNQLADGHAAQALGQFMWGWGSQPNNKSNGNGNGRKNGSSNGNGNGKAGVKDAQQQHTLDNSLQSDTVRPVHDEHQPLDGLPSSLVGVMSDLRAVKQELAQLSGRHSNGASSPGVAAAAAATPDAAHATQPASTAAAAASNAVGGAVGTGRLVHVNGRALSGWSRPVTLRPVVAAGPMATWIHKLTRKPGSKGTDQGKAGNSSSSNMNNIVSAQMPGAGAQAGSQDDGEQRSGGPSAGLQ